MWKIIVTMQKRTLFCLLISFIFCANIKAQYTSSLFASPKHEVRAVWLTTIGGLDWPHHYAQSPHSAEIQQKELCTLLDQYQKAGINTVLIQTRIRGTVIYPSKYEPYDGCLSGFPGKSPGYDALKFAIDECHKRGMELQAWVVTLPVGKWNKLGCARLRQQFPGLIRKIDADGYMNPEDPTTARYLADICKEITLNYDIDGIHLDYIRYPETWKMKVSKEQGRSNITRIVKAIHDSVKAIKPWVKISCSPIGKFNDLSRYWSHGWNAYDKVCQDAQGWLKDGLMDELFPMMYFRNEQFFPFAIDWAEQSHGKIVAPGLGVYFLDPKEGKWQLQDITREMYLLRKYHLGHTYFRGKFFTDDIQGIYHFAQTFDGTPALVPAMTWESKALPAAPTRLKLTGNTLSWQGSTPYYNIYSSRTWPVDIHDARNLVAARLNTTTISVSTAGRYFAVTAMDRYGNESRPLQSHTKQSLGVAGLLSCHDGQLSLPIKSHVLDAQWLVIDNLMGQQMMVLPYKGNQADVRSLSPGYYLLRSLGNKGISHRLGYFKVEEAKDKE